MVPGVNQRKDHENVMDMAGGLVRTLAVDIFYNNLLIKNCIVDYEQGVSDVR